MKTVSEKKILRNRRNVASKSTYAFGVACLDDSQPSAACSHSASSSSIAFWCDVEDDDDDRLFDDGWLECLD